MATFEETVLQAIKRYASNFQSLRAAAADIGIKYETFRSWHNGVKSPTIENLSPIMEKLGLKLENLGKESTKDVFFVSVKSVATDEKAHAPQATEYIAAPLVGEVGAGPGYLSQDEIQGWFMVHTSLPAIRYRRNLIAVEIGSRSTSMQPTLNPGDIVLIDRDDRDVTKPGKMMLVLDPLDGSGMVKRVSVQKNKDDFRITYYSDNSSKWPPQIYSLNNDFDRDWDRAIVGRVIWAWSDMREK